MMKDIKQSKVTRIERVGRISTRGDVSFDEQVEKLKRHLMLSIIDKLIEDNLLTLKLERDITGVEITAQLAMGNLDYIYELEKEIWKLENTSMGKIIETVQQAESIIKKFEHLEIFTNEVTKATEKFEKAMNN